MGGNTDNSLSFIFINKYYCFLSSINGKKNIDKKLDRWYSFCMKKTRKKGSGRKKGSYSFCNITLAQLNELLKPNMVVKVSRKWAVDLGVANADVEAVSDKNDQRVNLKVTDFEEDDKTKLEVKENW